MAPNKEQRAMKKKLEIEIIDKKQIPEHEPERQYYYMELAKQYVSQLSAKKGEALTFHVTTFGCQMEEGAFIGAK